MMQQFKSSFVSGSSNTPCSSAPSFVRPALRGFVSGGTKETCTQPDQHSLPSPLSLHPGRPLPLSLHPSLLEMPTKMATEIQKVHGIGRGRGNDHQVGTARPL
uniref:Pre-mRNA-processing ATP-dependent RNA helicase prp-5 n=1 Tax=Arundo donax TaxID=35708 RepID=A0A0A9E6Q0_ARUDO